MGFTVSPYLIFRDSAADALAFYRDVLGGTLTVTRMSEFASPDLAASDADKVMHGQLELDNGGVIMASDTATDEPIHEGDNFAVTISGDDNDELRGYFDALANGGTVALPFEEAPWGDVFGIVIDPFGVKWFVDGN